MELISSDELGVLAEEDVFEAVIQWVKHNRKERGCHLSELIRHIRYELLSSNYVLKHVAEEEIIKMNPDCKDFVIQALKYHLMSPSERALHSRQVNSRVRVGGPQSIVIVGGQSPKAIRNIEIYDVKHHLCKLGPVLVSRRCRCGVTVLNGSVYAVGGFDGSSRVRYVYEHTYGTVLHVSSVHSSNCCVHWLQSCWHVIVPPTLAKSITAWYVTQHNRCIHMYICTVCMSWCCGNVHHPFFEDVRMKFMGCVFCVYTCVLPNSLVERSILSSAPYTAYIHRSVEQLDLNRVCWVPVEPMISRRSTLGVGVLNGELYAVGGFDGNNGLDSAEKYNPGMHVCII